jgi:hypothetical protein
VEHCSRVVGGFALPAPLFPRPTRDRKSTGNAGCQLRDRPDHNRAIQMAEAAPSSPSRAQRALSRLEPRHERVYAVVASKRHHGGKDELQEALDALQSESAARLMRSGAAGAPETKTRDFAGPL